MELSEKLKKLRNEKGKTQQQASDEMKIAISSLRNYENGKIPDTTQLKIIKNYYGVTYEYLLENDCENRMNETVEIGKVLGLSDKAIEKIKNINIIDMDFGKNDKDKWIVEENIRMFNSLLENFDGLQDFLFDLCILEGNLEIYEGIRDISHMRDLYTYLIDCFYNDKNKLNEILKHIDNKIMQTINLLQIGYLFEYNKNDVDCLKKCKNDLISRLNQKKMTYKSKNQILEDFNEIGDISMEIMYLLKKEIIFNRYKLSSNINDFINTYKGIDL